MREVGVVSATSAGIKQKYIFSQWGHDFRKDYMKLGNLRKAYPQIPWIALTATAPKKVKEDVIKNLAFKVNVAFQVSCFRSNLYYDIEFKNLLKDDFIELKAYIQKCLAFDKDTEGLKPSEKPCGIIYCRKKDTTESVAKSLSKLGLACAAFHSGLKKHEKEQIQNDWMNGRVPVIAATVSFGMGIDKGPVRFVIHWDCPQSIAEWYQESGRAGRDGKHSFCRVYYDRDEVRSINFLLKRDAADKNKNNEQVEIAKQTLKEFNQIVDHCESTNCRHEFFTDFFGDSKPRCQKMCDSCKNKKDCQKNLDKFSSLASSSGLGSFRKMADMDPEDLYEGGRWDDNKKGSFENYDNSDDSGGFRSARELMGGSTKSLLEKQFALRKASAADALEMMPTAQISRVRAALSTETKVSGLVVNTREKNLTHIVDCLKQNKSKAENLTPPQLPSHNLNYKDLEDIAIAIEYECFTNCKAVSIYRRNFGKAVVKIKSCADLYPDMKDHKPKNRQSFGGERETIISDLKERFGEDVMKELEAEKNKKTERRKKNKFEQSGRDGLSQMKINSFFSNNPKKSPDQSSDSEIEEVEVKEVKTETIELPNSESDSELEQLNAMKENLKKELEAAEADEKAEIFEEKLVAPTEVLKPEPVVIDYYEDDQEEAGNLIIDEDPIDKGDGFPIEPVKRKADVPLKVLSTSDIKRPRMEANASSSVGNLKSFISQMVLAELNPFYKARKFKCSDPKALFKSMAREVTHYFADRHATKPPHQSEVKNHIFAIFKTNGSVSCVQDFKR